MEAAAMSESIPSEPRVEVKSDEDWKTRVKAEDAARDAEKSPQPPVEPARAPEIDPAQLPPADFNLLVSMLSTQALVALGVLPHPETGQSTPQPPLAKHFIDLLGMLEQKTRGNLNNAEERLLGSWLHQLRMTYVESTRSGASQATP
jgi:hypothetical protein